MKKMMAVVCGIVVVGVVTLGVLKNLQGDSELSGEAKACEVSQISEAGRRIRPAAGVKTAAGRVARSAKSMLVLDDDEDSKRTPEEKKLAAEIEKALDEEDLALAKKCADAALRCTDTEIRQAMVDTLGWFGEKAIPELTPFIADADEDVAESAMNEWEMAVSAIEDVPEKIGTVELAMQVISNEDALESISGEYIGIDEKLAVESLLRIIEGGGSAAGIAKAKETYEFVTGDEFVDRAAAEKWIAEEYSPE